MMARYDVNNFAVDTILSDIKAGEIAIPEMQRPFIWDASKVRDLLDSLYKGFPVGYIIVWQDPKVKLRDGTTSSGKKVLIDGQQRITALSAAIAGNEVLDSHYKWKRIVIAFNLLCKKHLKYPTPQIKRVVSGFRISRKCLSRILIFSPRSWIIAKRMG